MKCTFFGQKERFFMSTCRTQQGSTFPKFQHQSTRPTAQPIQHQRSGTLLMEEIKGWRLAMAARAVSVPTQATKININVFHGVLVAPNRGAVFLLIVAECYSNSSAVRCGFFSLLSQGAVRFGLNRFDKKHSKPHRTVPAP